MINPILGIFNRRNTTFFGGKVITSTTGAVAATSDQPVDTGFVVTRTGVGRYKIQFPSKYRQFLGAFITILGPDTAAFGATTVGGPDVFLRQDKVGSNTPDGSFLIQFTAAATNNDAELPDGFSFYVFGAVAQ